jgi:nitrate/TMAO reductase-like tetraheme cytochrome c subunit
MVMMDHATIIANDINCVSCHADLVEGTGRVTRRDCQNCHDQQRYIEDFDQLTTEVVRDYHRIHAAGQHARCNDCHQLIQHELKPIADPTDTQALLSPVREDCEHCHPGHHCQQIELLLGRGGFVEDAVGMANPMAGLRVNCRACHTKSGIDPKGEAIITSTLESCRGCHSEDYQELFASWQNSIAARLDESNTILARVEQQLTSATKPYDQNWIEAERLFKRAKNNIHFVSTAGGLHNKNYAMMLLDQAVVDLQRAHALLSP